MNSKNRQTINCIKEDIENILTESNPLDCQNLVAKHIAQNYLLKGLILDYRVSHSCPNISELREYKIQNLLDESFDYMSYQRPLYKWDIEKKLPNEIEHIILYFVKSI